MRSGFTTLMRLFIAICLGSVVLSACGDVKPMSFTWKGGGTWESKLEEGRFHQNAGKFEDAAKSFEEAAKLAEKKFGPDDARVGTCVGALAEMYRSQQEWLLAYKTYKRWMKIMQKADPSGGHLKDIRRNYRKVRNKCVEYNLIKKPKKKKDGDKDAEQETGDQKE